MRTVQEKTGLKEELSGKPRKLCLLSRVLGVEGVTDEAPWCRWSDLGDGGGEVGTVCINCELRISRGIGEVGGGGWGICMRKLGGGCLQIRAYEG